MYKWEEVYKANKKMDEAERALFGTSIGNIIFNGILGVAGVLAAIIVAGLVMSLF